MRGLAKLMEDGQNGVNGVNVLYLVVKVFSQNQENATIQAPRMMEMNVLVKNIQPVSVIPKNVQKKLNGMSGPIGQLVHIHVGRV